ncbi:PSP1 C-terminal conserved region-domain-containing protein [Lyophyllum atratum]|nr:PSP1 C-terminal conserved region-domain-containing protein [Lyophyllum atratum]
MKVALRYVLLRGYQATKLPMNGTSFALHVTITNLATDLSEILVPHVCEGNRTFGHLLASCWPTKPLQSSTIEFGGRGGLMLTDDDLASDLGLLNINPNEPPPPPSSSSQNRHQHPPSQPSSLPIYAPLSRSPPSRDLISPYQSINLNIPSSYSSQQQQRNLGTPSDGGLSAGGNSPSVSSGFEQHFAERRTARETHAQAQAQAAAQYTRARTASYSGSLSSPISPAGTRLINPQQQPFYPSHQSHAQPQAHSPVQRRPSDAQPQAQPLTDLGRGLPLSSVPPSWPLFIVEFKAGRTDLFYLTDLAQDIRVGDLVIVEADRGKDLGKVVNDSITVGEVEAFQRVQGERGGAQGYGGDGPGQGIGGQPTSPGGAQGGAQGQAPTGKKEINPKMIYGKAQQQDAQCAVCQDELKALQLCQSKVRAKKLPMEVVDAEYQWDRRKLTFYFIAEKRIDFRELVRELFRLYKTRIWIASLQGGGSFEQ